jgi:hypothetical protein
MLARWLLIALAVLMVLTAVAASLTPRESARQQDATTPSATSTEAPQEPVEATLDAQEEGQRVQADVGQNVTIVVRSSELDSVSIAEVGTETAEPDSPARFELLADTPGDYPIEALESGREIGVLEISAG